MTTLSSFSSTEWDYWDSDVVSGGSKLNIIANKTSALARYTITSEGYNPSQISFKYVESSSSTGHGVRLRSSAFNYVCGAGTDNPSYEYSAGTNNTTYLDDPGTYDTVTEVTFDFDWANSLVDINFSGDLNVTAYDVGIDANNVADIEVWTIHKSEWGYPNPNKEGSVDDIYFPQALSPPDPPSNLTAEVQ